MYDKIIKALAAYVKSHNAPPRAIYVTATGFWKLNAEMWEQITTEPSESIMEDLLGVPVKVLRDDDFVMGG